MKRPSTRRLREAANLVLVLWRIQHARRPELNLDVGEALARASSDLERLSARFSESWDEVRAAEQAVKNSVGDGS